MLSKIQKRVDTNHVVNLVNIDDDKYNFHGLFLSDPTTFSKENPSYLQCVIPLKGNAKKIFNYGSYIHSGSEILRIIEKQNKVKRTKDKPRIQNDYWNYSKWVLRDSLIEEMRQKPLEKPLLNWDAAISEYFECDSFAEIEQVRSAHKDSTPYSKTYDYLMNNPAFVRVRTAIEARTRLGSATLASGLSKKTLLELWGNTDVLFSHIFKKSELSQPESQPEPEL